MNTNRRSFLKRNVLLSSSLLLAGPIDALAKASRTIYTKSVNQKQVNIMYSNDICGAINTTAQGFGGLKSLQTTINNELVSTLLLDAGGFLNFNRNNHTETIQWMNKVGYHAVNLSAADLKQGINSFADLLPHMAFDLLSCNYKFEHPKLQKAVKTISPTLDIVVINAGIGKFNTLEHMTEEMFDEIMNINYKGAYFSLQQLLPLVNQGGSIILNTSINAHIGMAGATVYAASKAALLTLAKNLSAELTSRKIRVNAVSPGPVGTPLHSSEKLGLSDEDLQQMGESLVKQIPVGRFGQAEEIAKTIAFFASDDSSFILGSELIADGGMYNL